MIIFSDHAKARLKQRHIPKQFILEAMTQPDTKKAGSRSRRLYRRRYGDKILEVVATQENSNIIIITQYWLDKEES